MEQGSSPVTCPLNRDASLVISVVRSQNLPCLQARIDELEEEECGRQRARADREEARVARLEDELRAAKALWVDSRQRERDLEETAAFLEAQLAVAQ